VYSTEAVRLERQALRLWMLQQTVLGPSVRKTDLFTVHLCRQPLTVPRFPKSPHQHKYVAFLSPGELAKKVCGRGWIMPVYPTRHGISLYLSIIPPASLVQVLHLGTKRHGVLLSHFLSTVLNDFSVSTRRGV
jgi:hypothetical protein